LCGLAVLSVWGITPGLADGGIGGMFVDVPTTHPAHAAIRNLVQRGVIVVGAGGEFSGNAPLLRYDAAQWLHRAITNVEGTRAGTDVSVQVTSLDAKVNSLEATLTREIAAMRGQLAAVGQGAGAEAAQKAQTAFVLGVTGVVLALAAVALALWF
jgi:hypothetical protein